MHPISFEQICGGPFDPFTWFNIVGEFGCVFWVLAYVFIIRQCFKDKSYGLPLVAICMNIAWEFVASWVIPNPVPLWHCFDRLWFFVDLVIVYQLLRYGRELQTIPEIQRNFHGVFAGTVVLSGMGLYAFYVQYYDILGLVGAFMVNLVMSVTFLFFYFSRRRQKGRGLSVPAAWCKMLGTLGTSIECHYVIGMTQKWLGGLHFLTYLCLSIFLFDCIYIYAVMKATRATAQVPEREASVLAGRPTRRAKSESFWSVAMTTPRPRRVSGTARGSASAHDSTSLAARSNIVRLCRLGRRPSICSNSGTFSTSWSG